MYQGDFMFFRNNKIKAKFENYALSIKDVLLNQIIGNNYNCRNYYEKKYESLVYEYLEKVDKTNFTEICTKFVHDVYFMVPIIENT